MPLTRFRSHFSVSRSQLSREGSNNSPLSLLFWFDASSDLSWRLTYRGTACPDTERSKQDTNKEVHDRRPSQVVWFEMSVPSSLSCHFLHSLRKEELKVKSEPSLTGNPDTSNQQAQHSEPPAFRVALEASRQNLTTAMERVQHMTKSAIRRASQIEVNPQAKRNLQELFVNFTLILICLLLIYIIVLLSSWGDGNRLTDGLGVRMRRSCVSTGIRLRYGEGQQPDILSLTYVSQILLDRSDQRGHINPSWRQSPDSLYVFVFTAAHVEWHCGHITMSRQAAKSRWVGATDKVKS